MNASILDLPARIAELPDELRVVCEHIVHVSVARGTMELPQTMHEWTAEQFGSVEAVREQMVVKATNRLTLEGALFNPVRALRPSMSATDDAALESWIADELQDDIFADPELTTPTDPFGRIHGAHCITASNIAKFDGLHGVVICNQPHPLHFDRQQVRDYVDVAWRWLEAAHRFDAQAIYPMITWNCLPKSGASLAHGHIQVALGRDVPYSRVEIWRRAAETYRATRGRSYFDDLYAIHDALGLSLPETASVRRFAHLTPMRNKEVVLLGKLDGWAVRQWGDKALTPDHPIASPPHQELADVLYDTLHTLVADHGVRAFNAAIAFPPLVDDGLEWRDVPIIARIGDRGNPLAAGSDIGAMELYGTSVITVDPYEVVEARG